MNLRGNPNADKRDSWLLIMAGPPGSGKTMFANAFRNLGNSEGDATWKIVSRDEIRHQYIYENYDPVIPQNEVWTHELEMSVVDLERAAVEIYGLQGFNVVIDDTNLTRSSRKTWINMKYIIGATPIIVTVEAPLDMCLEMTEGKIAENRVRETYKRWESELPLDAHQEGCEIVELAYTKNWCGRYEWKFRSNEELLCSAIGSEITTSALEYAAEQWWEGY